MEKNDGVYSRYLTELSFGSGRYTVDIIVDDNGEKAFSYLRTKDSKF